MTYRTRNIVAASGLALVAVIFMLIYVSKSRSSSGDVSGKSLVTVLLAKHDIDAGTPGSTLQVGAFTVKRVPRAAAAPERIASPLAFRGQVATQDILAGEQATARKFGPIAAAGVRSRIRGFQRVVQLSGDANQILDGTLEAGDRVDVLGSWTPAGCATCRLSGVIVRNALVLKTSSELSTGKGSDNAPVQLRLTDEEANVVFWVQKNGAWWLMLRPVVNSRDNNVSSGTASSILQSLKKRGLVK